MKNRMFQISSFKFQVSIFMFHVSCFLCFFILNSEAQQNCYNNPSMEGTSQAHVVPSPWASCWGSPDTQPGQWGITLPPSNGVTYVSFLASNNYGYLEGMTQPLTTCMVAGQTYTFTVDLAHTNIYNTADPGDCYSAFAVWGGNSSCDRSELLYCSGEIWNTTWQSYTITFTPTGNWCYIGFSPCYLTPCSGYINLMMDNISCINPVSGAVTTTNVTCFGVCNGTASVNPLSGTPPFTYSWTGPGGFTSTLQNISNLCPGTYTVTITDATSQTTTADGIVTQPPALVVNTTKTDVSCAGGSNGTATVNASGGTGAYTYLWSPGGGTTQTISGRTAGTYCVTVTDANSCQASSCVTILDGGIVAANISSSTNVSCSGGNDGSATVTVTDGVPPYMYLWSNGQTSSTASFLTAQVYCVTVTDLKGCNTNVCVTITQPSPLVAAITSTTNASCNGFCNGQATVIASGGTSPYTYLWDNGQTLPTVTALCAGTSVITLIDNKGCTTTASAIINEPAPLALNTGKTDPGCVDSCDGSATVTVAGGTSPYTYLWNDPNASTTSVAGNLCEGTYIIQVTDNNGCIASATVVLNDPPLFIAFIDTSINVSCNGACNGYAQVSTSGVGPPYTYIWNNGQTTDQATNLCPGTHLVMVTNTNGCRYLASTVITEPPPLTATISSTNVTCFGACNGVATVTASGGITPYTYQWNDNSFQTTPSAANLCSAPGGVTYMVIVTDSNGCVVTGAVTITQPLQLGLTQAVVSPTTCSSNNGSACVSPFGGVSPYTVVWNDSNATDSTCLTNVFAGMYNPTVTDFMGCQYTTSVLINDIAGPTIDSIYTNALNCYGDVTGTATVYISGGTPSFSYIWNTDAGDTIAMGSVIVFGLGGGNYSVTVIDANSCVKSDTFSIYEPPQLNSAILLSNNAACKDSCDGDATVTVVGGTPGYAYSWSSGGQVTPTATGLCMGLYYVTVTDANGCTSVSSDSITEPPALTVIPAVTNVSCNGLCDGIACLTPGGGTPPYTYLWNTSPIQTTNCITGLCDGTYNIQVTDANGCIKSVNIPVSEPQLLTATGGSSPSTCGYANGVGFVSPQGGTPPYNFLWNDPDFQTNDTASGLLAGPYNVTITDNNGCTLTFPVSVTNIAGPVINSIAVTDVDCFGGTNGSATVSISGGTLPFTYTWSNGQNTVTAQFTNTTAGLGAGSISVEVRDLNGCIAIGTATVAEPDTFMVYVAGEGTICFGASAVISVSATTGGTSPYTYTWDNNLPGSTSHVVSPVTTTTYNVTVTDVNNCTASASLTVTVNPPLTVSAADVTICRGDDAILGAGVNSPGNGGPYAFTWDNSFVGDTQTVSGLTTDGTIFRVILSDGCSLNDTDYVTVFINDVPAVSFNMFCVDPPVPSTIQFNSVVSGGVPPYSYQWNFGDGITGAGDTVTHVYPGGSGLYNVNLTVTTVQGCQGNAQLIIQGPPNAVFVSMPIEETSILNPVFIFDDTTFNALTNVVTWEWDFDDGDTLTGYDSAGANPTHTYLDTGLYNVLLTVYNSDGCKDTAWRTVRVISEYILFAPNAFSIDGDVEKNRYFRPVVIGVDNDKFEIFIYDRWGNNIYEYDGSYETWSGWDGRANGGKKVAQMDVYVWVIELEDLNGDTHQYIGHVTLLK